MKRNKPESHFKVAMLSMCVCFLAACAADHPPYPTPQNPGPRDGIPMARVLTTNDWEQLDSLWGINAPSRHIWIKDPGFHLRKKVAFIGGSGDPTSKCVDYGGALSTVTQTVEVLGKKGQEVRFVQGAGDCPK